MARGWESKSVESQQADALESRDNRKRALTPEQAANARRREGLLLSRKRILDQMEAATHPRHKQMLQDALAELDVQLAAIP